MSKYRFLGMSWLFMSVLIAGCDSQNSANRDLLRPNIILIMADDLGYETIGANGGKSYDTPVLDQMAKNGIRFEHCYAQPLCTPSRVQIMTGIYNVRNYVRFGLLDESQTTFGHLFQDAGYNTCVIGKWQLGKDPQSPQRAGFDTHCLWQVSDGRIDSTGRDTRFSKPILEIDGEIKTYAESDYGPRVVSNYGMEFIEKSHQDKKPFFLYYPMILTHCPFSPTPDSPEWMQDDTAVMKYKGNPKYFEDMVKETDHIVGRINAKLEDLGIEDNTLVIFTGDNGTDRPIVSEMNGRQIAGAKNQTVDAGTRVPLIIKWPDAIKHPSVYSNLIDFSDFLPTICDAAGIELPDSLGIDGQSFYPQISGEKGNPREWIYCWYSRSGDEDKARVFARNQRYKLYASGEFYEIPEDYDEVFPLDTANLEAEEMMVFQALKKVIDDYAHRRLENIPVRD